MTVALSGQSAEIISSALAALLFAVISRSFRPGDRRRRHVDDEENESVGSMLN